MWFQKQIQNGAIQSPVDGRDLFYGDIAGGIEDENRNLPREFILPEFSERIKSVKNQGRTSSCVAQASAYAQGYQLGKELSARYCFKRAKEIDPNQWGLYTKSGIKTAVETGICDEELCLEHDTESDYAYLNFTPGMNLIANGRDNRGELYVRIDGEFGPDYELTRRFLFKENRPVVISIYWYGNYNKNTKDGILPFPQGNYVGHCVLCIGWKVINGKGYYIILNSFGKNWGDNGINYLSFNAPTMDAWGIIEDSFKLKEQIKDNQQQPQRNIGLEKVLALKLRDKIYEKFAKTDRARSWAFENWPTLVGCLAYKNYTIEDLINQIYAGSRGKKLPFNLNNIRK